MDLSKGFRIDQPRIFAPWSISENEFQRLFRDLRSRSVTDGYFTAHCTSLGGFQHELGFHFHPQRGGRLIELEFFRRAYSDLVES